MGRGGGPGQGRGGLSSRLLSRHPSPQQCSPWSPVAEKHQNLEDREKICPSLVAQGSLKRARASLAPLPVPAVRVGPGKLLLGSCVGGKEWFPGHVSSRPGEDLLGQRGAGSDGGTPEDKRVWDRVVTLPGGGWGPHLSSIPADLHGHRSSVGRGTVTLTAPSLSPRPRRGVTVSDPYCKPGPRSFLPPNFCTRLLPFACGDTGLGGQQR